MKIFGRANCFVLSVLLSYDFFYRLLLKDTLPLTDHHFVMGNTPANLRMGLDIDGKDAWSLPPLPITISIPICADNSIIQEHVLDYVDVGPID